MATIGTSTTPSATVPEQMLRVTGAVRLVLVISLSSFVEPDDADTFRHGRGSEAFTTALRALQPQPPFLLDDATAAIERDAYALRIFRSRLTHNHFLPTYRVAWDSSMRARLASLNGDGTRWQRWDARLRLTRDGLAVITLEEKLEHVPLITCAEHILELPSRSSPQGTQDQWTIGMTILTAFLDAIGRRFTFHPAHGELAVRFSEIARVKHTLRLDRYVVFTLRRVEHAGVVLSPDELKRDYAQTVAAFMEGSLIECDGSRRFPRYSAEQARALMASDVSSWDEELCLFTGESALLYYPLIDRGLAYVGGPLGLDAHAYGAYWAGIVRGIEYLVAYRAEVQQLERRTTDLLKQIPALTRSVHDGTLTPADMELIEHLATGMSDIFDSLPEQRSMAVSATAFRADYTRRKFEALLRELDVPATLDLVNTNVEQLNFFLSYYNAMRLQWQGQHTNSLGVLLGAVVTFMAISSFLADTFNVLDRLADPSQTERALGVRTLMLAILIGLIVTTLLWLAVRWARKRFTRRHH